MLRINHQKPKHFLTGITGLLAKYCLKALCFNLNDLLKLINVKAAIVNCDL